MNQNIVTGTTSIRYVFLFFAIVLFHKFIYIHLNPISIYK